MGGMRYAVPPSLALLFALAAPACVTGSPGPAAVSSVEYVMLTPSPRATAAQRPAVRPPAYRSPAASPPAYIAPTSAQAVSPPASTGGVVRVEPIRRTARVTRSDAPPTGSLAAPLAEAPEPVASARSARAAMPASPEADPGAAPRAAAPRQPGPGDVEPTPIPGGPADVVLPYPLDRVFRGFGACRGERHHHEAIDIGGVGPHSGLGTPIRAMARARVTFIGRPEDDPRRFGQRDTRSGATTRGGRSLPRSFEVEGYGEVHFFTRTKGQWRTGVLIRTEGVGGTLDKHLIRYMHLGEVRPGLKVGDVVEAGEEIGLMGGTGVQESAPHLHLDVTDPSGKRLDVAPLLGLEPTARECPERSVRGEEARVWSRKVRLPRCGVWERQEDFASGEYHAHDVEVKLPAGRRAEVILQRNGGAWQPRVEVLDAAGDVLIAGGELARAGRRAGGAYTFKSRKSGRHGDVATLDVTAAADAEVTIRVTAWPRRSRGLLLPRDGEYGLEIRLPCDD